MNSAQDTFDALRNEIDEKDLVDMLVERAIQLLESDDANPQVGFGLFISTAIEMAAGTLMEEATRWRRNIFISIGMKTTARNIVTKKRAR
jgi:hypothetical protein